MSYSILRNATPGLNSHSIHWLRGLMGRCRHTFQMSENDSESCQHFTSRSHKPRLNGKCWTKKAALFLKFLGLGVLCLPSWNAECLLCCLFSLSCFFLLSFEVAPVIPSTFSGKTDTRNHDIRQVSASPSFIGPFLPLQGIQPFKLPVQTHLDYSVCFVPRGRFCCQTAWF